MARAKAAPVRRPGAIYTEEELAQMLHTTQETLRGLRQTGAIRYLQVGRKFLYPDEYLQEYIDRGGRRDGGPVAAPPAPALRR